VSCHRWSLYRHVKPGTQEEAAERVDVAPRAAINRRPEDIGQPFGGKPQSANQPPEPENAQYLSRFSSAVEQRFCKPKVGSSILSTGTSNVKDLEDDLRSRDCLAKTVVLQASR
jgi:hypothetical protein